MFLTLNYDKFFWTKKLWGVISNLNILTIPPFIPKTRLTLAREEAEQTESQLLQEPLRDVFRMTRGHVKSLGFEWVSLGW